VITIDKKQHFLGYFTGEVEAARAYDKASLRFRGVHARVNFDSVHQGHPAAEEAKLVIKLVNDAIMHGPTKEPKKAHIAPAMEMSSHTAASIIESPANQSHPPTTFSPPQLFPPHTQLLALIVEPNTDLHCITVTPEKDPCLSAMQRQEEIPMSDHELLQGLEGTLCISFPLSISMFTI